jgi:hypothetical protein
MSIRQNRVILRKLFVAVRYVLVSRRLLVHILDLAHLSLPETGPGAPHTLAGLDSRVCHIVLWGRCAPGTHP